MYKVGEDKEGMKQNWAIVFKKKSFFWETCLPVPVNGVYVGKWTSYVKPKEHYQCVCACMCVLMYIYTYTYLHMQIYLLRYK